MANVNIPDLTALTAPATADVIEVYDDSASQNKKMALSYLTRADGNGPQITGGGTIALGGYTLTVPATGTAALLATANVFDANQSVGTNTTARTLQLNGPAASGRSIGFYTAGVLRWLYQVDSTAESGGNAGSDFRILARTDAGTSLSTPLFIRRSDGAVGISTTTPVAQLDVRQTSTTAAIPALLLRQEDASEDLIEVVGTSSTGNATNISTDASGAYAGRIQITVNGARRWLNFYADA